MGHINFLFLIADLQMVNISLRVLARPDQTFLPQIYRQIGTDYDERVLPSICNEVCQTEVVIDDWTIFSDQRFVCDLNYDRCNLIDGSVYDYQSPCKVEIIV